MATRFKNVYEKKENVSKHYALHYSVLWSLKIIHLASDYIFYRKKNKYVCTFIRKLYQR